MKRAIAALAFVVITTNAVIAQEPWSLTKCIEHARTQNLDVQRKSSDMKSAEVRNNTAKNSRLPSLSASLNQNISFGYTIGANNTYGNQNSASTSFGVNAGVNLFQGNYINNSIRYTSWNLQAAVEDINQVAEDISIKVTLSYLQILYNKELVRISAINVEQSNSQVKKAESLVANGKMSQSDLVDAKAQLAKDEYALTKANSDLKLALLDLSQIMELPSIENFDIEVPETDKVAINSDAVLSLTDGNIESAYSRRPAVKAADYRLQAGEQYIKMMKSAYYPTINFIASYGNSYYYLFNQTGGVNTAFGTQLKNQSQEVLGLQVNIPIFNRFETRNNVRLAQIGYEKSKIDLIDAKKALFKDMQQAYYNAMTAQQNFVSAQKALEASDLSFKYTEEKFSAGRATVYEITEVKKRLTTSQAELAQARYEYIFRTKLLDYYHGVPITL